MNHSASSYLAVPMSFPHPSVQTIYPIVTDLYRWRNVWHVHGRRPSTNLKHGKSAGLHTLQACMGYVSVAVRREDYVQGRSYIIPATLHERTSTTLWSVLTSITSSIFARIATTRSTTQEHQQERIVCSMSKGI